jgi:hypothetical protein
MTTRTVKMFGLAYGSSPAEITVTSNGETVYSGTVPTLNQPPLTWPDPSMVDATVEFCTFEIDMEFTGQIPMTSSVSSGTVIFANIFANYRRIANPVYTSEQISALLDGTTSLADRATIRQSVANPPLSQQDIDALSDPATSEEQKTAICREHNCTTYVSSGADRYGPLDITDARSSVTVDGIPQTPERGDLDGTWWWKINNGSTLGYDLEVTSAGVATT